MAAYNDHLACETYPYIDAEEFIGSSCCKEANELDVEDERVLDAIDDASIIIYYLTGKQFGGTCTGRVRPPCLSGFCHCGCTPNQIELGFWPVTELTSIRYQGETLEGADLADFQINEFHYLARKDGEPFLSGNQFAPAGGTHDNEDDGYVFEVTFEYGLTVPRLIKRATKALACELLKGCGCLAGPCKLPEKVTNITRSGLSMTVTSAADLLEKGRTGIYEVDMAIKVFNPIGMQSPSFIFQPQKDYGRRIGT